MRPVFLAAILLPAAASVAHSQQARPQQEHLPTPTTEFTAQARQTLVARPTPAPSLRPVDAPIGITRAQARPNAVGSNHLTSGTATVDNNTRNTLAIVGAVVIVLALVAFLL